MNVLKLLFVFLFFFAITSNAETRLGTREVLLDNDKVEAVRLRYPVGTESGVHTHKYPSRTIYVVKGGKLKFVEGGKSREVTVSAGKLLYAPASTHNVINVGDTEVVLIEIELK
ncbi:MAG: cupin domain-containing protein [Proteobacteria bacterium]|nr:cupin domain-containing protein [Pseudomonadota bacterium]